MWYALAELYDGNRVLELFWGEELKDVSAKLERYCDEMMQFDLEEMTMDEIDAYYTEGYDEYEKMIEESYEEYVALGKTYLKAIEYFVEAYDADHFLAVSAYRQLNFYNGFDGHEDERLGDVLFSLVIDKCTYFVIHFTALPLNLYCFRIGKCALAKLLYKSYRLSRTLGRVLRVHCGGV